ncbi:MAG: cytidine deaminase [Clostridiales bacterium]|nr:cytidine deaminase [Clostridiales bacterium]
MKITKADEELIEIATQIVLSNTDLRTDETCLVGCALRAASGNIYKGINIQTSHSICSEQVAIANAFSCGERAFDTLVAVKMNEDGTTRVVSPCGVCRYLFDKLELDANVIVEDVDKDIVLKVKAKDLLPYPYKREDEKN